MCTALAKTPAEAGQVTLPELSRLLSYWRVNPPTHLLAKMATRYKPPEPEEFKLSTEDEVRQLVAMCGG